MRTSGARASIFGLFRAALLATIPLAGFVVALAVRPEGDRAFVAAVLGIAWLALVASTPRVRWAVGVASGGGVLLTAAWALVVWLAATPCALSGRGILQATPQCPVQATHVVGLIVGGASCVALAAGVVAGIRYASRGDERALRLFRAALLVAAVLILVWLGADLSLPRNAPSD